MSKRLFAKTALMKSGWADDVLIEIGDNGKIIALEIGAEDIMAAEHLSGPVIPGQTNLHSHAFQRVMAGMAERLTNPADSFWTWRDIMYKLVARLTPDDMAVIAQQLYVECLKHGYTNLCEFHYVHHGIDGTPYEDVAETSKAVMNAASRTGIALTHLPVLYSYSGFGREALNAGQKRFGNDPDGILAIIEACKAEATNHQNINIGLALHSLRAVDEIAMTEVLKGTDTATPVHIHIAEQLKEVTDCVSFSGQRPVDWLYDHADVDENWCLVHATHLTDDEISKIAVSSAVAGICPTTEGNLGDGLFPLDKFLKLGGRFGIGSDSHVSQSPVEELRLLEYGQRLNHQRRNIVASEQSPSAGRTLWENAANHGAISAGRTSGSIAVGQRADLVVLDDTHVNLAGRQGDMLLDSFIFAGNDNMVRDVMVGGKWVVEQGHHVLEMESRNKFIRLTAGIIN